MTALSTGSLRHLWHVLLLAILMLGNSAYGEAQDADSPVSVSDADAPPVIPPVAKLFDVRSDLQSFLQSIQVSRDEDRAEAVSGRLDELEKQLATMKDAVDGDRLATLGFNELLDLQSAMRIALRNLSLLTNQASARAAQRDAQLDELAARDENWQRLTDAARERNAPDAVLDTAADMQAEIDDARRALETDRNDALEILSSIAGMQKLAMDLDQELTQRRDELEAVSQTAADAPLWSRELWSPPFGLRTTGRNLLHQAKAIALHVRDNAWAVAGLFLAIWIAAHWLLRLTGNRVRDGMQKDSTSLRGAAVFERPSSAALLTAIVGLSWLGPPGPSAFAYLLGAVIPYPAAALAITAFAKPIRLSIYTVAVVLSIMSLVPFLAPMPLVSRLLLIAQAAATALAVWSDYRRGHFKEAIPVARPVVITWSVRIVCATLLLSIVFETVGLIGLANTLRMLVLGGLGLAMIFAAIAYVLIALSLALVHLRPFSVLPVVRNQRWTIVQTVRRWIRYGVIVLWVTTTLKYAGLFAVASTWLDKLLAAEIRVGEITLDVSSIAAGVGILFVTWLITSIVRFALAGKSMSGAHVAADVTFAISKLLRYAIAVVGFVFALAAMGFDLTKVTVIAGALGLGIGIGLQNIVQNFISGLILLFERPIKINDITSVDQLMGTVKELNIRSTVIETFDGAEVIVPNADLVTKTVTNWTKSNRRRRAEIDVGVAYGSEPKAVLEILEKAARSHREVMSDPEPFAIFVGFGDSALNFRLYVWLSDLTEVLKTPSRIREQILDELESAGISIPFPQRDVRVTVLPDSARIAGITAAGPSPAPPSTPAE